MSGETKFGYGFLLAGVGVPYLIDKLFGPLLATIIACFCLVGGVTLLIAGHSHRDSLLVPRTARAPTLRRVFVVLLIVGASAALSVVAWRLIQSRTARDMAQPRQRQPVIEFQQLKPSPDDTVTKSDLENMERRLLEKMQAQAEKDKDGLDKKYPLGYFLFAGDKQTNVIPLNKEAKSDFSLDWENCRIAFTNHSFVDIALKNFHYYPTEIQVRNLDVVLERKIGTVADGIFFNNIGLFVELIDDRTDDIIYVIGFKKVSSIPKIRELKPEVAEFIKQQLGKPMMPAINTNIRKYINIEDLVISSGWTTTNN
jgi:hypothetical protein